MTKEEAKGHLLSSTNPLDTIAQTFIQRFSERLNGYGVKYKNDISYQITPNGLTLDIPFYYEYLEKGVNGTKTNYGSPYSRNDKMPPLSIVKEWMNEKGIETNGTEYAIQKSWHENGLAPKVKWTDLYETMLEDIQNEYIKYIINEVEKANK